MIVVADTTPLNYLMLIGEIDLLPRLFGRVLIPFAVFEELNQAETPSAVRNWMANPPPWLEVRIPRSRPADALDYLDQGERAKLLPSPKRLMPIDCLSMKPRPAEKPLDGIHRLSVHSAFCEKARGEAFWIFLLRWHACKQRRFT
jgi:hypothetical protein